ncbi:transaldolase [Actinoalloteichus hoggarensis]|uniref:Transaldolase n=1 Tax=Actinoalloteichus hoggarensis TaxID=1470176 RepID=A0A221W2J9_9PSEU|nr:transaldolase [Actinoalloteichus hoggarensis]ASO19985.1 Transaldolase [Actinoalloteichus hoggarensis]MBB5919305.1 transaldolase [Actinoalloteichus hoggarensis]
MSSNDPLAALSEAGVSIWLDDLSRERMDSGNLDTLIRDRHLVGVTTNPTIFAAALAKGTAYDEQVAELAARGASVETAVHEITTADVRRACDVFRPTWEATDRVDGRVSLEVDPRLAHDSTATEAEATALWQAVDRPNLFIKIPATVEGVPAITRTLANGISVNVTLIFSVDRYREVMDAFLEGLEQAKANGHDLRSITSVASFFVSRVDSEVDKRLDALGTPAAEALRGKAAIANARLAFAAYEEVFSSERWQALAEAGARPQRPLWASTGVKDPAYSDTRYVDELVTSGVVNTMPEKTLLAAADHATVAGDTVRGTGSASQEVFDALTREGVDIDDVYVVLENEGVTKFEKSWEELLETVAAQLTKAKDSTR